MRNKLVKQLLMFSVVASMVFGSSMMVMASETGTTAEKGSTSDTEDVIEISKGNASLTLYKDEKLSLEIRDCKYTPDASDINFSIDIENNTTLQLFNKKISYRTF